MRQLSASYRIFYRLKWKTPPEYSSLRHFTAISDPPVPGAESSQLSGILVILFDAKGRNFSERNLVVEARIVWAVDSGAS